MYAFLVNQQYQVLSCFSDPAGGGGHPGRAIIPVIEVAEVEVLCLYDQKILNYTAKKY